MTPINVPQRPTGYNSPGVQLPQADVAKATQPGLFDNLPNSAFTVHHRALIDARPADRMLLCLSLDVSPSAVKVAVALAYHGWSSWPSRETLCRLTALKSPNVSRACKELEEAGVITRRRRYHKGGNVGIQYTFNGPAIVTAAAEQSHPTLGDAIINLITAESGEDTATASEQLGEPEYMSEPVFTTYRIRAYTSKQGYAHIDHVLHECANLYNAALEERTDAYKRGWTATSEIPLNRKGLTAAGCWTFDGEKQIWTWLKRGNLPPQEAWLFRQNGAVIHKATPSISCYSQQGQLPALRGEDEFWNSVDNLIARGVLRRLDKAMAAFFRRVKAGEKPGYPRFRSRHRYRTINLEEARPGMLKGDSLYIKGLPRIRIPSNRDLPPKCQLASLTITRKGRRLYVGLTYKVAISTFGWNSPDGLPKTGADMGVTDRVALASGETTDHRQSLDEDIQRKQKRLSKCRKGSREWRKRAAILANAQDRRRTANRQEAHRITTDIVSRFSGIGVEDLQITNLTKSNRGTETAPNTNVAQKTGLNREINAQAWGMIIAMLAYKAERAGRELVKVDPRGTSQTCSICGVIDVDAREKKIFSCGACGLVMDADVNAAINIKERAFPEYEPGGWEFPAADPRVCVTCAGNYP